MSIKPMTHDPSIALWTDGEVTIVLSHVTYAFWEADGEYEDELDIIRTTPKRAKRFVIHMSSTRIEDRIVFDKAKAWRDQAVSFLRALNMYWETRT